MILIGLMSSSSVYYSVIVAVAVATAISAAIIAMIVRRKKGKSNCGCDCSNCSGCIYKKNDKSNKE